MKLKIRNIILLVLHTIATTLLFFPFMYYRDEGWVTGIYGHNFYLKVQFSFFSLISGNTYSEWSEPVALVIFILFFVVLISLLLQLVGKSNRQQNSIVAVIITIVNFCGFFWYSYFLSTIQFGPASIVLGEVFYIELLLQVVSIVFFIFSYARINGSISVTTNTKGD